MTPSGATARSVRAVAADALYAHMLARRSAASDIIVTTEWARSGLGLSRAEAVRALEDLANDGRAVLYADGSRMVCAAASRVEAVAS